MFVVWRKRVMLRIHSTVSLLWKRIDLEELNASCLFLLFRINSWQWKTVVVLGCIFFCFTHSIQVRITVSEIWYHLLYSPRLRNSRNQMKETMKAIKTLWSLVRKAKYTSKYDENVTKENNWRLNIFNKV